MTKEDKELLIKDLGSRLTYNVKVRYFSTKQFFNCNLQSLNPTYYIADLWSKEACFSSVHITNIKPYLFPLSSMTEEQRMELNSLLPVGVYLQINSNDFTYFEINTDLVCCFHIEFWDKFFDWLNKNHFDYRGLIEKGLSLDATGLNIY